ncbi:Hypothetical protein A7982_00242 [Minicystis rosea]|nr:Hypothetical protein A7982_00242 [Minicystis rosea]
MRPAKLLRVARRRSVSLEIAEDSSIDLPSPPGALDALSVESSDHSDDVDEDRGEESPRLGDHLAKRITWPPFSLVQ